MTDLQLNGTRTPENWCAHVGKQRHATRKQANAHRVQQQSVAKDRDKLSIRRCSWCDGYHIGRR